jgi:hypothetical protein
MKIKFLHTPKPRQYDYKPVFYDPKEEEKQLRKNELGIADSDNYHDQLRAKLRQSYREKTSDPIKKKSAPLTIAVYILLAIIILYLIFGG